jgi:hypothetical protein
VISGTAVKWYDSTGSFYLTQPLEDGVTYYTQAENGCENTRKLAVTVCLSVLYLQMIMPKFCDDLNDGSEKVNLSDYNSKLISNTGYNFPIIQTIQLPKINQ